MLIPKINKIINNCKLNNKKMQNKIKNYPHKIELQQDKKELN